MICCCAACNVSCTSPTRACIVCSAVFAAESYVTRKSSSDVLPAARNLSNDTSCVRLSASSCVWSCAWICVAFCWAPASWLRMSVFSAASSSLRCEMSTNWSMTLAIGANCVGGAVGCAWGCASVNVCSVHASAHARRVCSCMPMGYNQIVI